MKLNRAHLTALRILNKLPCGSRGMIYNTIITHLMTLECENYWGHPVFYRHHLDKLAKCGYVSRSKDVEHPRHVYYSLGPLADKLKEEGVLE